MKKLIILLSSIMLVCLAGCEEDKEIKPINPLIENSAETCEILNANVDALHAIIEAIEGNIAITQNVASNLQHSITFSNNRLAHIYLDTSTNALPFIYAKKENGVYYWYHNGVWLLDANQNRVEVLKNKLSFKIIDGYWFISFDNKKYENYGAVRGNECIRFFKSFNTKAKATTFVLSNQHKYEYRWYDENDIRFEDPTAENICSDNWDTNYDMALSYDEAAAVTDIGNVFRDKSIVSFDELQYFVGLQTIGSDAFYKCSSLTSITIPNSVTSIGYSAFEGCSSLREFKGKFASTDSRCLIVNNSLKAFAPAGLTEYTIPDSVTSIGYSAFYDCSSLTSITIPNSVTSIDYYAFSHCSSLTSITIPNSVTYIGRRAFYYCSKLTSITIPNSVTSIGYEAFYNCSKLTSIYCTSSTPPTGSSDMFNSYVPGRKIYVPKAAVDAYKTAASWSSYASDIVGYDF